MQRRTLGTREALEGILEDAATPTRAFASDYGYDLVSLLLPGDECSYVMGNPPFIGHQQHTQQIKDDMELVCGKAGGSLDYVAGWYFKAIDFLDGNPSAQFAFVSTNSITQGQHKSPRYSSMWSNEGGVSGSLTVRSAGTLRLRTMRTCMSSLSDSTEAQTLLRCMNTTTLTVNLWKHVRLISTVIYWMRLMCSWRRGVRRPVRKVFAVPDGRNSVGIRRASPIWRGSPYNQSGYLLITLGVQNSLISRETGDRPQMWKYSSYSSGVGARRAWSISPRLMPIQVSIRSSVKTSPAVRKS